MWSRFGTWFVGRRAVGSSSFFVGAVTVATAIARWSAVRRRGGAVSARAVFGTNAARTDGSIIEIGIARTGNDVAGA